MTEPTALHRISASDAARMIAEGSITSEALVYSCLERIDLREPDVQAWAYLNADLALAQARACDQIAPVGPLHGIPIGVKDIIETGDMPTEYGSAIYPNHRSVDDATCIARARAAGAVIIGKTVSTEFAYLSPAKTANPHNLEHTPGGSSSGSAAGSRHPDRRFYDTSGRILRGLWVQAYLQPQPSDGYQAVIRLVRYAGANSA